MLPPSNVSNTHLYREIYEQPDVLSRLLDRERQAMGQLARAIKRRQISHVVVAARGTSDNAGRYAQYVLGAFNRLPVALATPSLFSIYHRPPRFSNTLVLGISQSGQSPDIVSVLAEARRQGALTAVITNNTSSDLAREGDFVVNIQAGEERAVAATKTYSAEVAAVALLGATLVNDRELLAQLQAIPDSVGRALGLAETVTTIVADYRQMVRSVVIGRGFNYATAFETALKIKELTYLMMEPYSSADFLHGPLALIEPGFRVIIIAPSGQTLTEMQALMRMLSTRQAAMLAVSDDAETLALAQVAVPLPQGVPEWLSPLTAIVPGQLFALHLAYALGHDVDAPRGLQKVTETH